MPAPTRSVWVAARALAVGERLTREAARLEAVPVNFESAGALSADALEALLGAEVAVAVPSGRPLQTYWFKPRR
jgi:Flp pilus assembly protein CpaB